MSDLDNVKVYVTDQLGQRVGELDVYTSLKAKKIFNDVGTCVMEVSRQTPLLVEITTPGFGIEVWDQDTQLPIFYGWLDVDEQKFDATSDTLTVTYNDDNVLLSYRLAHPSPAEAFIPYNVQAYDVFNGQVSSALCHYVDVNLGLSAVSTRVMFGLASVDAHYGNSVSVQARWQNLLEWLKDTAVQGGDVGFRVDRPGHTALQFVTYAPRDKTDDVKFSTKLGNVRAGSLKVTSPKGTYVYAGGSGDLTARLIAEASDAEALALWGRREYFYDINNISDATQLQQAAQKATVDQGATTEFSLEILNTDNQRWGVDYDLGDKVTAIFVGTEPIPFYGVEGGQVQELIREIDFTITSTERSIVPIIGTPDRKDVFRIFREIRRLRADLQRRQNN